MEQKIIKISILQMSSIIGDVDKNINKVSSIIEKGLNTDVLVLPEVWSCGWSCQDFQKTAKEENKILKFLSNLARDNNINIIGGSIITKKNEKYYNSCPVISRDGNLIGIYNKMHLYSYYGCYEDKYIAKGQNPLMVNLGGVNFGLTICYDIRFPEIYRAYTKAGADILVNCASWGANKPIPWEVMTKSRAVENQTYMIALTQSGKIKNNEYNLGESRIIDYKGEEINSIMSGEGIVSADINLDEMYDFRNKCKVLKDINDEYEVKTLCVK